MDKVDYLLYEFYSGITFSEEKKKLLKKLFVILLCIIILCILIFIYPAWGGYYLGWIIFLDAALYLILFEEQGRIGTKKKIKDVNQKKRKRFQEEQERLIEYLNEQGLQAQSVYNILKERQQKFCNKNEGVFLTVVLPIIISGIGVLLKPLENSGLNVWTQYVGLAIVLFVTFSEIGWSIHKVVGVINIPIKKWYWQKYEGDLVLEYLEDMLYL